MILLGLPTNRVIKPQTAESIIKMAQKTKVDSLISTRGYNTAENRNYIAAQAVKGGYSHLFLTDDDMIYEPDTIHRLYNSGKDIIGGLYRTKYEKQEYVLEADEIKDEMFECKAIGGGLLMIKTDVLKKVPQPWFGYKWYENGMVKESNDWFFCNKAREYGYKIWCDPNVKAKHIGIRKY